MVSCNDAGFLCSGELTMMVLVLMMMTTKMLVMKMITRDGV